MARRVLPPFLHLKLFPPGRLVTGGGVSSPRWRIDFLSSSNLGLRVVRGVGIPLQCFIQRQHHRRIPDGIAHALCRRRVLLK